MTQLVHSATLYIYCKKKTVERNIRSLSEKEDRNGQMNETGVTPVISLDSCFHLTSMQVCLIQGNTSNVPGVTGGDTKHKPDGISPAVNMVQKKVRNCYRCLCKHTHKDKEKLIGKSPKCYILSNKTATLIKLVTMTKVLLLLVMLLRKLEKIFPSHFKRGEHFHSGDCYAGKVSEFNVFMCSSKWSNYGQTIKHKQPDLFLSFLMR